MKKPNLKTIPFVGLCLLGLYSCQKLNFIDPDIKKPDTNKVSTLVKKAEYVTATDTTTHTISYKADGSVDNVVSQTHYKGVVKAKSTRFFKTENGLLTQIEVKESLPYDRTYLEFRVEYNSSQKVTKIFNQNGASTLFYDQNGYIDYFLFANGDSTEAVQDANSLHLTYYPSEYIALKKREAQGDTIDSWPPTGSSYWKSIDGVLQQGSASIGGGIDYTSTYTHIPNPLNPYVWELVGGLRGHSYPWLPKWTQPSTFESKIHCHARYQPYTTYEFTKDAVGRVRKIDLTTSTIYNVSPDTYAHINLYY